jgi:signal transduction histidine kinase
MSTTSTWSNLLELDLSPVKNQQGEVEGVVLTLMETTERKKAEETLSKHKVKKLQNMLET